MNTRTPDLLLRPLEQLVEEAGRTIAPTWPLDRWIAVNPFWNLRQEAISEVAARLGTVAGLPLTMPREHFRAKWEAGEFELRHVRAAIGSLPDAANRPNLDRVVGALTARSAAPSRLPLLSDLADARRPITEPMPWARTIVDHTSQHLAAFFDRGQATWRLETSSNLYGYWLRAMERDRGLQTRTGPQAFADRVQRLPREPIAALAWSIDRLGVAEHLRGDWLTALLATLRGWASWCAHERWQADLKGATTATRDDLMTHLLAIRATWEVLLLDEHGLEPMLPEWHRRMEAAATRRVDIRREQQVDWILLHACEIAFQERLARALTGRVRAPATARPRVQAVFCIDVRSERLRRALEAVGGSAVATRGFAGFFGLPIGFRTLGEAGEATPSLPGLLAPAIVAEEVAADAGEGSRLIALRQARASGRQRWANFRESAGSIFSFVETLGGTYLPKLLGAGSRAAGGRRDVHAGLTADEHEALTMRLTKDGRPLALEERVDLAAGVLRVMGIDRDFAPLVLLAGHGSSSTNNPHAAGLDCGACGGQTGEVNARLLADLLNDPAVRIGLADRGVPLPVDTWFLAGLHDTTTDEVRLFPTASMPAEKAQDMASLRLLLAEACERTRAERAPSLGLGSLANRPAELHRAIQQRSRDWAQTRPEWGLAGNAAFVVAPRALTRGIDLEGRAFLHDYDWQRDDGFAALETIVTAPMVVTNWINLQYFASVVAPEQLGSGNKVLHNIVGGDLGVFEGNGGDLRIGLARQSVHDGHRLMHEPLRLSVLIAAPRAAIDDILRRHEAPRSLCENGWLHLLRIDDDGSLEQRRGDGEWARLEVELGATA
jgi:uncharacterized protein